MNRLLVFTCVLTATLTGCRSSSCCRKPACSSCNAPPPVILGSPPTARQPEVLFPSAPPSSAPLAAPAPNFPAPPPPQTSGYAPMTEFAPSRIANVPPPPTPEIRLEKPEFSETMQRGNVSLKPVAGTSAHLSVLAPTEVVAGKVATGRRPTLDDLDRLNQLGYRQMVDLSGGDPSASAKHVLAARSIELKTIEANDTASRKIVSQAINEATTPVYVCADDPQVLRAFWQRYYHETEHLSNDAAKICAARLVP